MKDSIPPGLISKKIVQRGLFFLIVAGMTWWFFDLVRPFLMSAFWAIVLAIVFDPVHTWLLKRMPERNVLAASLTTVIIMLAVILPLTLVGLAVADQVGQLVTKFNNGEIDPNVIITYIEQRLPLAREFAEDYGIDFEQARQNVNGAVAAAGQKLLNWFLSMGQNFLGIAVEFFLMLYFLWFFLKDGRAIVDKILAAVPLGNSDERTIVERFAVVSRATLKGTLIVAIAQGTLGGVLFWGVGIEAPIFWGVVMTLLSLLPIGGSSLVWAPAAVILAVQGQWTRALIIVAVGGLAIGLIDNLLRPQLVGRDTQMPDYLVLIATLGGIATFGLAGFVVGPVVAALFITVWEIVQRDYGKLGATNRTIIQNPQSSDMP